MIFRKLIVVLANYFDPASFHLEPVTQKTFNQMSSTKHSRRQSLPISPANSLRVRASSIPPKVPLDQLLNPEATRSGTILEGGKVKRWFEGSDAEWDMLAFATAAKLLLFPA
jgi:hypothetical protein